MTTVRRPATLTWRQRLAGLGTGALQTSTQTSPLHAALVAMVVLLNLFGLVMVMSASSVQGIRDAGGGWFYFNRQLVFAAVGFALFFVVARLDYGLWRRHAVHLYGTVLVLLVAVLAVGRTINGSTRWLPLGPFNLQPSEVAKLGVLVMAAKILADRVDVVGDKRRSIHTPLLVLLPVAVLVLLQPDLGTTIIVSVIVAAAIFVAGAPLRPLLGYFALGSAAAVGLAFLAPYRRARLLAFTDPWADVGNTTYHTVQSMVGLATGGVWGTGLGESRAKWGFLPNSHSDFIYAVIGEELGLVGALVVLGLVGALGVLGFQTSMRAPDRFGVVMAAGITTWFVFQAFVNIGGVIGLMPITGVTLPFVSFGGSSLLVNMVAAGILVNIARHARPL